MRGMKSILKMGTAMVLSAAMIVSPMPLAGGNAREALAVEMPVRDLSRLRLGTQNGGGIIGGDFSKPYEDNHIDHVYYGKYKGEPVKYRVLNGATTDYNASGDNVAKILLHSETIVDKGVYSSFINSEPNEWKDSTARRWLNGSSFLLNPDNFSSIEEGAIAKSYKSWMSTSINGVKHYDDPLDGEKVFVLSATEACNLNLTFTNNTYGNDQLRIKKLGQTASNWWLRTRQESSDNVWYVSTNGSISQTDKSYKFGYVPAFAVVLNDVLFSYMVTDYNPSSIYGKDYTFTLRDTDIGINAPYGAEIDSTGKTLTFKYNVTGSHKGNVNRLSVLVLDKEYSRSNFSSANIKDYRPLKITDGNITSGTATVTLNADYSNTSNYIYLVAEDINGTFETDYAGDPVRINAFHQWKLDSNTDGSVKVTCSKHSTESYTASISQSGKTYDGAKAAAGKIVSDSGFPSTITAGSIYYTGTGTTSYSASTTPPTDAGTYLAYAVFKGPSGEKTAKTTFTIEQKDLTDNMVVLTQGSYEYDGNVKTTSVKVTDGNRELKKDTDYTINASSVLSATGIGSYEIKVDGLGNYKGSVSAKWIINKHVHSMAKIPAKAATETAPGNSEYYYCNKCGKYYSDAQGTQEIAKDSWVIRALGHTHNLVKTPAKAATETAPGNSEYYYCNKCGKYYSDAQGTKEIAKDSWVIRALGHTHNLVKTPAKAATETAPGNSEYYYCNKCGKYYSDAQGTKEIAKDSWVIKALGHTHNLVKTPAKAATETSPGNSEYYYCNKCGKYYSDAQGKNEIQKNSWIIPAKGKGGGSTKTPVPAKAGKQLTDPVTKAKVTVVSSNKKNPTVAYKKISSSSAKTVTIPATVKIGGVKYKVTEISKGAFKGKTRITKVTIGKNITKIGAEAFSGCTNLTTVSGGAAVKTIGAKAFYNCKKLKAAKLGSKVTSIGASAFYNCKKLTKTPVGSNVTSIGDKAFFNCASLATMTLPAKTAKLGKQFAKGTKSLRTLTVKNKNLKAKSIAAGAFDGMGTNKTIVKVPQGKKTSYTKLFRNKGLNKKIKLK